ncbi:hypothetical protein SAMN04489761_0136 [Tenacibaculum sp. MAR_2009_124]|uniref:hypothetical protein n=1 Tax=Tenacibaculum sp. MAR_2009_124 TaxID=1250059 RepID=UPI00089ADBB2|nr:hypothetical protein [Tenacibaculum sp. MAR_2009_124]SEB36235.1 hypothetical protein SAMN04489761_0136 [Tenacibaculum sp. MAR_2009_124]
MKLETYYSMLIEMYLKKYAQIKLHIDASGKVAKTEKESDGVWLLDRNLKKILNNLPITFETYKNVIVTLKH